MISITIVIAILIFGSFILIHELGHFLSARACGVTVHEFAIGMGPKILKWTSKKTSITYSLRLLPFGGFVSMAGEDENDISSGSLRKKPVWQRIIISSSGAAMNIILGFILMFVMVITMPALGSTTVAQFEDEAVSKNYGLELGDKITKVGDVSVHTSSELVYEIMRNAVKPINITVERGGKTTVLENVQFPTVTDEGILFGEPDFLVSSESKSFFSVMKHSFYQSISSIKMIWQSLYDLITGKYGIQQMSGPVGVTQAIGKAATTGSVSLLYLCTLISMNLGIFNLLPLPALDGGRIVFLLVEWLRGKPVKPEIEGIIHFAGILLLMLLMVFITYKDIIKLITKT